MAKKLRPAGGSSATRVEGCNDLIHKILLGVPLRDVLKMFTVDKRWRSLILDPFFAHTHYKNHRESMFLFLEYIPSDDQWEKPFNSALTIPKRNTQKIVIAGFLVADRSPYTLVFNSQSNSWYEGRPLVLSTDVSVFSRVGTPLCFNGIIFIVVRGKYIDAHELNEPIETLFRDDEDFFYRIIGYDVNEDQWSFSIFIPASVGFLYCITEWEGNLLVCASNSTYDRSNQRIRYSLDEGDGHFVFWKLSTKHKLWTEECELDLSNIFHAFWKVSASSGVV